MEKLGLKIKKKLKNERKNFYTFLHVMLCKTKSSGPFQTEPKNDFTPINPTNQSPNPKIRAIIGYFQSQKFFLFFLCESHLALQKTYYSNISFHIISLFIVRLIVRLGFENPLKKIQILVLRMCSTTVSFVESAQTILSSQFRLSSHHDWNHLGEFLIGVTLQRWTALSSPLGSRQDTEQINVNTTCVENTCTVSSIIGPIIYMGGIWF